MPEVRARRARARTPEPPLGRARVLWGLAIAMLAGGVWAVLSTVLITVLFVLAIVTLKGGFAALVVVGYLVWLWVVLRRLRARRRR